MSFEMADNHFMFLVTLPILYESMKVRRKVREHSHNRELTTKTYKNSI